MSPSSRATAIGLLAIILWSTSVGLLRSISEHFGATGGAALIYTVSALALCLSRGLPDIRELPRGYLFSAGILFVSYEICFALAIGLAETRDQSLELGLINYLWPCLTIVLSLFINGQRSSFWLWPGLMLTLGGVFLVMQESSGGSFASMWSNIEKNPLPYGLAFSAAITWALYCNLTRRFSKGKSGVSLFFCATAVVLWVKYALTREPAISFSLAPTLQLLFMGVSTAAAYSVWNRGIQAGNMTLLATASYFTPISSALLASLWLGLRPGFPFWQGVIMVVAGSLICWLATRHYR
ncbi:aromatic amino acid DMT transporter YddG [uncultured Cedecea sp.]|uniref:aromatic amino acid DMT transporter YddG n=1 Tax=uncultured Cedecea sp. TaxID=988762 RepID=UPI002635F22A|nr:aromatic amino acid DMT transporter YddG [uncultured Cedecea sp.]